MNLNFTFENGQSLKPKISKIDPPRLGVLASPSKRVRAIYDKFVLNL
jgi:hypothetical protein